MAEAPFAMPTIRLAAELIQEIRQFVEAEVDLARAEFREIGGNVSTGLAAAVGGAAFLLAGLIVLLAAGSAFLLRLGLPLDAACLIVAVVAFAIGWLLLRFAQRAWQPQKLTPARSLAQISSLMGRR
jgi:membrane protein implicated in regulation of membrane protease activity